MSNQYDVKDKVRGCLVGVALGDALGMPWELMSHEQILESTSGKGVTGLQDVPPTYTRKIPDTRGLSLGETTDDWQLTRVVAESLIRCRGFDVWDQALGHVAALESGTRGWGGSTREAVREFKAYFDSRGVDGRRPGVPAIESTGRGLGNGILMKLAPIACWNAVADECGVPNIRDLARRWTQRICEMSHVETVSPDVMRVMAIGMARKAPPYAKSHFLGGIAIIHNQKIQEVLYGLFGEDGWTRIPTAEEVREKCGTGCNADQSAAFTIATALRNHTDFRAAILEAINAGGDTDTNASIVGAMVGGHIGFEKMAHQAPDWLQRVPTYMEAIDVADRLCWTAEDTCSR